MRARQRHFNAGRAGALLVLDARYINGISNGSTFETWSDISGNAKDATQATSTRRPTYRASSVNGLPAVESFAGSPYCSMDTSITNALGDFFTQVIYKDIGTVENYERLVDKDFQNGFWMGRNGRTVNAWGGGIRQTISPFGNYTSNITDGSVGLVSIGRTSSTKKQSANGTEVVSTNVGSTATGTQTFRLFYNGTDVSATVQISQVILITSFPSDALLKLVQRTSAYAFKIACS